MLLTSSTKGKTGSIAKQTPVLQANEVTLEGAASPQCATRDDRLEALQRQFSAFGLSLRQLGCGGEFALTGPMVGLKTLPDARCAWVLLRRLREGSR